MASDHFAALMRIMTPHVSRRAASRALAGLLLGRGMVGAADAAMAKKGRCPCRKRKNGTCVKAPKGHRCGVCRECRGGRCVESCTSCQACAGGACEDKPNETLCDGNGLCLSGICNPEPTCAPHKDKAACPEWGALAACCSGQCREYVAPEFWCCPSTAGKRCYKDADCLGNLNRVGYRCV